MDEPDYFDELEMPDGEPPDEIVDALYSFIPPEDISVEEAHWAWSPDVDYLGREA